MKTVDVYNALMKGDVSFFSQFQLQEITDFRFTNHGRNLLHLAAWYDRSAVIETICKNQHLKRALLDAHDHNGDTPLHLAVHSKSFEAYKKLIQLGANTNIKNIKKDRPLDLLDETPECTDFLKKINTHLSSSIPEDKKPEVQKRIGRFTKIALKVHGVPEDYNVEDEEYTGNNFIEEPSRSSRLEDSPGSWRRDSSRVGLVPSISRQGSLTASRRSIRSASSISPNSILDKFQIQDSNRDSLQIQDSHRDSQRPLMLNRSVTRYLDPQDLGSAKKFLRQKSSEFDELTSDMFINQLSGTSNIFENEQNPEKNSKSSSSNKSVENIL